MTAPHSKMSNITEATANDWEDFWYAPEKFGTWYPEDKVGDDIVVNMDGGVGGSWKVTDKVNNYVDDVLSGKNNICKRESPLSE